MRVTVLGTGAYGLALANMLNQNNNEIILWSKFEEEITYLQKENKAKVLPNIKLTSNFKYTFNMKEAVNKSKLIIIAVPAGAVNEVSKQLAKYYKKDMHIFAEMNGIPAKAADRMLGKICSLEDKMIEQTKQSYLPDDQKEQVCVLIAHRIAQLK